MDKMTIKDGQTMDIVADNIEQLKTIFPEVFAEGKVDFDRLQSLLGEYVNNDEEHYNFTWHGKKKAQMIAQTPSTGTLRPAKDESKNWEDTQNLLLEGDNLEVLKLLQKSYHRKVKMIYIDPPYNTGNEFVYNDDFKDNIKNYQELTGQTDGEGKKLSTNSESNGRYHTDWLNMMYPRLKLARNLLTDDGVIFISIDDNEQANLKKLCDDIFGESNFVGCISRICKKTSDAGKFFAPSKDYSLVYSKNINKTSDFKQPLGDLDKKQFKEKDGYGLYKTVGLYQASLELERSRNARYFIKCPDGSLCIPPENKRWRVIEESYLKLLEEDKIVFKEVANSPLYDDKNLQSKYNIYTKMYLSDREEVGKVPRDFADIPNVLGTKINKKLNIPFSFAKPIELLTWFLRISSSDKDSIILDFFAGSGTTSHAVMHLNAEDGGNRRCISVQLPELTEEKSEAYKAGYKNIADITKERIRRAGAKIIADNDNEDKKDLSSLDTGFKVFKLDSSNIKTWDSSAENFDPENLKASLFDAVENIKSDRNNDDVLYELLIKTGIDLSVPMTTHNVQGKTVHSMGLGALIVCLDKDIDNDTIIGITKLVEELNPESTKVIFKDDSFISDVVKTNALQTLKRHNITDIQSL